MKRFGYIIFNFGILLIAAGCYAQEKLKIDEKPEMAVSMRSNGKIYVVVAVVVVILMCLFLYLVNLDVHIRRLEKKADLTPDETDNRPKNQALKGKQENIST